MNNYEADKRIFKLSEMDKKVISSYSRMCEQRNESSKSYTKNLKECFTYFDKLYKIS